MNMEKVGRKFKELMIDEVLEMIKDSPYIFFVNFQKLPVSKVESLRRSLKKSASDLKVVKISILKLALKKRKLEPLCELAEGSSGVTFGKNDPVKTSKILYDFSKADEGLTIRGGYVDGQVILANRVKELAMLPSREVLFAKLLATIKAPLNRLVNVLNGNSQKLVYVMSAISKKEEKGG